MAALLPAAVYLVLVLLLLRRGIPPRRALLLGAVGWGVLVVVITESLSVFETFSKVPVALSWTAVLLVSGGILAGRCRDTRDAGTRPLPLRRILPERVRGVPGLLAAGASVLLGGVLLVAVLGAPNNGDSMSYHLPRVMHWIQNGSVAHYPTWIPRQLYQPPMAEFAVAHFQLLYGSDRLAGLVQWCSLAGSALAASMIAARLGAGGPGQVFGFLFVVTLPMGLLQGMTTQNDLVLAFWLAAGTYFALEAFREPRDTIAWDAVLPLALCLGLAVLTKGTGYLFGFPLLVAAAALALYRHGGRGLRVLLICTLVILLLNGGHYARNAAAFGHPLIPEDLPFPYLNRTLTPATLVSNVVRNLALQAATPFEAVNDGIVRAVEVLHDGMDLSVSDRRITWRYSHFRIEGKLLNEDHASNPLHLVLVLVACLGAAMPSRSGTRGARRWLAGGILAGFLVFCAVLQWQPWHARLQLPLMVASAPLAGAWVEDRLNRRGLGLLGALLVLVGGWVIGMNRSHPLIGGPGNLFSTPRQSQYFTARPVLEAPYRRLADHVRRDSCRRVGLIVGLEEPVYPLWVLLSEPEGDGPRLVHVPPPDGPSPPGYFLDGSPRVCGIVCTVPDCEEWMDRGSWSLRWNRGDLQWWIRFRRESEPREERRPAGEG